MVGIDCAIDEARTGLAFGLLSEDGQICVERATLGTAGESAVVTVAHWIGEAAPFVVALNAPLGWPRALSEALASHRAGESIGLPIHQVLRRRTEQVVADAHGRLPPEVAADRVARTALSALQMLEELRGVCPRPIPMAWVQGESSGAIEVHSCSTLRAHGLNPGAYRGQSAKARSVRREIATHLAERLQLQLSSELLVDNAHLLDAVVSVLAAADFALGACKGPADLDLAEREGWIWVRSDGQQGLF